MPWNRDKVRKEPGRTCLPRGVEDAVFARPAIAYENIIDLLESGDASTYQFVNCILLLNRLVLKMAVNPDVEKVLSFFLIGLEIKDVQLRNVVAFQFVTFLINGQVYEHMETIIPKTKGPYMSLLKMAPEVCKVNESGIKYILELNSLKVVSF